MSRSQSRSLSDVSPVAAILCFAHSFMLGRYPSTASSQVDMESWMRLSSRSFLLSSRSAERTALLLSRATPFSSSLASVCSMSSWRSVSDW